MTCSTNAIQDSFPATPGTAQRAQVQSGQGGDDGGYGWLSKRNAPHLDTATPANGETNAEPQFGPVFWRDQLVIQQKLVSRRSSQLSSLG